MKTIFTLLITIALTKVLAQHTIDLTRSHNPVEWQIKYEVDFMKLDSARFFSLSLEPKEIKRVRAKDSVITVSTKLPWVYNDQILTKRNIKNLLENISTDDIRSLKKLPADEAVRRYGIGAKYGAMILKTKQ